MIRNLSYENNTTREMGNWASRQKFKIGELVGIASAKTIHPKWYGVAAFVKEVTKAPNGVFYYKLLGRPHRRRKIHEIELDEGYLVKLDARGYGGAYFYRVNPYTPSRFQQLADEQRAAPETAMRRIHAANISQLYGTTAEHVGDLIHRMSEDVMSSSGGYQYVLEKVSKTLRWLTNPYGFEREVQEQASRNYEYYKELKLLPPYFSSPEAGIAYLKGLGREYAEEHRKLPAFNSVQKIAQEAAIALGLWKFETVILKLRELKGYLSRGVDEWTTAARLEANATRRMGEWKRGHWENKKWEIDDEVAVVSLTESAGRRIVVFTGRVARIHLVDVIGKEAKVPFYEIEDDHGNRRREFAATIRPRGTLTRWGAFFPNTTRSMDWSSRRRRLRVGDVVKVVWMGHEAERHRFLGMTGIVVEIDPDLHYGIRVRISATKDALSFSEAELALEERPRYESNATRSMDWKRFKRLDTVRVINKDSPWHGELGVVHSASPPLINVTLGKSPPYKLRCFRSEDLELVKRFKHNATREMGKWSGQPFRIGDTVRIKHGFQSDDGLKGKVGQIVAVDKGRIVWYKVKFIDGSSDEFVESQLEKTIILPNSTRTMGSWHWPDNASFKRGEKVYVGHGYDMYGVIKGIKQETDVSGNPMTTYLVELPVGEYLFYEGYIQKVKSKKLKPNVSRRMDWKNPNRIPKYKNGDVVFINASYSAAYPNYSGIRGVVTNVAEDLTRLSNWLYDVTFEGENQRLVLLTERQLIGEKEVQAMQSGRTLAPCSIVFHKRIKRYGYISDYPYFSGPLYNYHVIYTLTGMAYYASESDLKKVSSKKHHLPKFIPDSFVSVKIKYADERGIPQSLEMKGLIKDVPHWSEKGWQYPFKYRPKDWHEDVTRYVSERYIVLAGQGL